MAGLGFGGAEVWGGGVEGGEDGGGEGREGEGSGAGGCSEECHRALEWRGEVKVLPSLSPPSGHVSHLHSGVPTPLRTGRRYPDIATSHAYVHPPRLARFPLSDTHAFQPLIITYLACGI